MPITSSSIAGAVRGELARLRVRQSSVATLLGLSQAAVSARLSGQTPFRADELARLADELDVPVARFYEAEGGVAS